MKIDQVSRSPTLRCSPIVRGREDINFQAPQPEYLSGLTPICFCLASRKPNKGRSHNATTMRPLSLYSSFFLWSVFVKYMCLQTLPEGTMNDE